MAIVSTPSKYLVETDWLKKHLNDSQLRILDCTVLLRPNAEGVLTNNGREAWENGHIPGSQFIDLSQELSDKNSSFPLMMPPTAQFADTMSRYGIGEETQVVLYDACSDKWAHIWAARVWWMLRVHGFDNVVLLNGGWHKWILEKRPVSKDSSLFPPARFISRPRPELIADKEDVLKAIGKKDSCIINALTPEEHAGTKARYGRAGHIPSSVNVPAINLIDPLTKAYLPIEQLRDQFKKVDAFNHEQIITYCGGGIAASSDAFVLTLLGKVNVAVYDGSLFEWASDPKLPMEI